MKNDIAYRYANCKNFNIYFKVIENTVGFIAIIHASRGDTFIQSELN